jgi:arylformamidase
MRSTSVGSIISRQYPSVVEGRAMRIYDVTLTIRPGMTIWGDEPGPTITPLRRIAKGDTANASTVCLGDHTGTHVDPPLHYIEGGTAADALPIDALLGPCAVLAFEGDGHVSAEFLERAAPKGATRLLFKTRNSARWADPAHGFTRDITAVSASAARWAVDHGVRLVGIDYLTIEPQGPEKAGYPTHHALLGAGVVIIEGLDLRAVRPGDYELVCAPMKIGGADGAPARVFLVER